MTLTIGQLAKQAAVHVETIRYYERIGLLSQPEKPMYGFRHYPASAIARIRFIKRAQRLGFTLKEIAELLSLGDGHCQDVRALAEKKRQRIERHLEDLQAMREVLDQVIASCRSNETTEHCSLIEILSDNSKQDG